MLTLQTSFYFYFYSWRGFSQSAISTLPLSLAPNLTLIHSLQGINYFSHLDFRWNKFQPRQVWWEGLNCSKVLRLTLNQSLVRQWGTWILAVGLFSRWHLPTTTSCQVVAAEKDQVEREEEEFLFGGGGKKMSTYLRSAKEKKTEERKKMGEYKKNEKGGFLKNGNFSFVKSFLLQQCSWLNSWRSLVTGDEGSCWPPW